MNRAISVMAKSICAILGDNVLCIYLYGSVVMDDFKLGWSDIDILCFTKEAISEYEAEKLINLRQNLLKKEETNPYYRSFEGAILSIDEFKKKQYTRVVYWGTSGQRITDKFHFDVFSQYELIKYGQLIFGRDIRDEFVLPKKEDLKKGVQQHYQSIRKYAIETNESLYSCGWLLDIARCIYTLRYNDIIGKTMAGEWALKEKLFPQEEPLCYALEIRYNPLEYKNRLEVKKWLRSLRTVVQLFADVLERELGS